MGFVFPKSFRALDLVSTMLLGLCKTVSRFPEISACLALLSREAPHAVRVAMSGSGASVFAAFADENAALESLSRATRGGEVRGFVARSLNRHPLQQFAAP